MSVERIREHILESAQAEARKAMEEAEKESAQRMEEVRRDGEERLSRQVAQLEHEFDRKVQQELAKTRTGQRSALLKLKTEIIEGAFAKAVERLRSGERYQKWLRENVGRIEGQKGTVLCRAEDRELVEKVLRESGVEGVSVGEEPVQIAGGWLLRSERYDVDMTLEAAIARLREEVLGEMGKRLGSGTTTK